MITVGMAALEADLNASHFAEAAETIEQTIDQTIEQTNQRNERKRLARSSLASARNFGPVWYIPDTCGTNGRFI
jgi:hypothetical protein